MEIAIILLAVILAILILVGAFMLHPILGFIVLIWGIIKLIASFMD